MVQWLVLYIIVLIFSNVPDLFSPSVNVMPPISSSDHLPVIVHSTENYHSKIQNSSGYVPTLTSQTLSGITIWKIKRKCLMHSSLTTGHMYLSSIMTWLRLGGAGKINSWRMSNPSFLLDLLLTKPVKNATIRRIHGLSGTFDPLFAQKIDCSKERVLRNLLITGKPIAKPGIKQMLQWNAQRLHTWLTKLVSSQILTAPLANGGVWLRPCVAWAKKFCPTFLPCSLRHYLGWSPEGGSAQWYVCQSKYFH